MCAGYKVVKLKSLAVAGILAGMLSVLTTAAYARDIEYANEEITVRVTPGEPTQVTFPGKIAGGFKPKLSPLTLDRKGTDLIIFAQENIAENGSAIIVRLDDGRSYSIRVQRSTPDSPRDDVVRLLDKRGSILTEGDEEEPGSDRQDFKAPSPATVAGLMREMVIAAEFGEDNIPGYRVSDRYKGQVVLNDGTVYATIDRIFIGSNLWGYVIDASNTLDQTQKVNPATFRIDGTRAISATNWELAPRPMNVEQQIAGKDKTRVYVITRARSSS